MPSFEMINPSERKAILEDPDFLNQKFSILTKHCIRGWEMILTKHQARLKELFQSEGLLTTAFFSMFRMFNVAL